MKLMKKISRAIPCLITLLLILPAISLADQFKVTRVYDGDTIEAEGCDIEIKVRLVGIDAPETSKGKREPSQPYSQQAKKYLVGLVLNKFVEVKGYGLDRYNRILGVISLEDKNINVEMIKVGLAEVYRGKPPPGLELAPFWRAEKEAKAAKRGMWSLGEEYISPQGWRRMHR
jgi:endonuclease YncB( thermonuclease family)